jgi:hypothetical protein
LQKINKGVKKRRITLISNPLKKLYKTAQKNVISKTGLTNMSKSKKSAFFANNFFGTFFQNIFNGFEISVLRFLTPFLIFLGHISTFSNFNCKWAGNGPKKHKIFFYERVLEFNFATIKGFA